MDGETLIWHGRSGLFDPRPVRYAFGLSVLGFGLAYLALHHFTVSLGLEPREWNIMSLACALVIVILFVFFPAVFIIDHAVCKRTVTPRRDLQSVHRFGRELTLLLKDGKAQRQLVLHTDTEAEATSLLAALEQPGGGGRIGHDNLPASPRRK
jgi:hypothetical protein